MNDEIIHNRESDVFVPPHFFLDLFSRVREHYVEVHSLACVISHGDGLDVVGILHQRVGWSGSKQWKKKPSPAHSFTNAAYPLFSVFFEIPISP